MTPSPGAARVVFVGAGPGDPGLLTVRGQRALEEADVLVFDADLPGALLEAVPDAAERVSVGGEAGGVGPAGAADLLVARAGAGLRVARIMAGDGRDVAAEVARVAAAGLTFELVPGASVATAGLVHAGILGGATTPSIVVEGGSAGLVLEVARARGAAATTLAIGVAEGGLAATVRALLDAGREPGAPAAWLSSPGTRGQRTVDGSLGHLPAAVAAVGFGGPGLLVVGEAVARRTPLAWLEARPLATRRVLVTRPRAQAGRLAALLEAEGAEVLALPTIAIEPPDDWGPLDLAIGRLAGFGWVLFTSANGVEAFRKRLFEAGRDVRALGTARVAAIGPETAEALRRMGVAADLVPGEFRAEGLVEALRPHVEAGSAALLVRAAEARDALPRALQACGVRVTEATAYRTRLRKEGADTVRALVEARALDAVTFTSSSTVRGLVGLFGPGEARRLLGEVVLAAIGPVTGATAAEYGLEIAVMPREYTAPALAAALAAHFTGRGAGRRFRS